MFSLKKFLKFLISYYVHKMTSVSWALQRITIWYFIPFGMFPKAHNKPGGFCFVYSNHRWSNDTIEINYSCYCMNLLPNSLEWPQLSLSLSYIPAKIRFGWFYIRRCNWCGLFSPVLCPSTEYRQGNKWIFYCLIEHCESVFTSELGTYQILLLFLHFIHQITRWNVFVGARQHLKI